jgi:hydroxybutyrate-dimer hydrolase
MPTAGAGVVQVPANFDAKAPCIVSATSSGSRGVYGAIGSAGEWGLKRGCAVAYTDKGTGSGVHALADDSVNLIDGRRAVAAAAGRAANFNLASSSGLTEAQRTAFNAATPHRLAVKHAHSQRNPEADWGQHTLQAIQFAFWVLNDRFGHAMPDGRKHVTITPANTLVIASSVSNGAGAALAAAEQDALGLIDGVAVSEPQVQVPQVGGRIERVGLPAYTVGSRPLMHYVSYANLLQPCAALAPAAAGSPFAFNPAVTALATNRCAALAQAGLVSGVTLPERAADALARLQAHGWEPESNLLHASHFLFATPAIAVTYANTYGRFSVLDSLCGFSFATVDANGNPAAAAAGALNGIFGSGNGIPPTGPIQLVYNPSVGGARTHTLATSPSTNAADLAFDGANCLRQLVIANDANAQRVQRGVQEVLRSGNLRGKPTLIVQGRADTLVPPNFSARPYVMANARAEGATSKLRYIEVANAQHFDAFLPLPGYDSRFVPLHLYFVRAMDAMWAHLKSGAPLPQSQLVRTTPRGGSPGAVPALSSANVPPIAAAPAAADRIEVSGSAMRLP